MNVEIKKDDLSINPDGSITIANKELKKKVEGLIGTEAELAAANNCDCPNNGCKPLSELDNGPILV